MAILDRIFGKKKTLSDLDRQELRKEEILLTKQRDRLFNTSSRSAPTSRKSSSRARRRNPPNCARPSPRNSS